MLTLYIADAERGVGMKNLSQKEAIALLRNLEDSLDSYCGLNEEGKTAFRMAIEALSCSEIPNNSDTISRQAAIDVLCDYLVGKRCPDDGTLTCRLIENEVINKLPSVQPEQQWIPCSERLPEKEGWYITTIESEKTGKRRIENDLFAVDIALAHGHTPNKFCKDGYRQRTVAWMPFPEPYQEESEDKE